MGTPVSVVIPVRDNPTGIKSCLGGLERQGMILEIIVVDDHSSDDTRAVAEAEGARVISSNEPGAAAARNTGALAARGQIILFTDADCIPAPGWARSLLQALQREDVVAAKGTYRTRQQAATARFVQAEYEERYDRMDSRATIDFLDTYSLAVRREDLLAIGGFDEGFQGASVEDQEMSFRLLERGKFKFVPEAVVHHRHAETPWNYARKKFRIGRGKATLLRRHPDRIRSDSHTPDTLRWQVVAVLVATLMAPLALLIDVLMPITLVLALSPIGLSIPLLRRATAGDRVLYLLPFAGLLAVRGWSLSLGFGWGVLFPSVRLSRQIAPIPDNAIPHLQTESVDDKGHQDMGHQRVEMDQGDVVETS